MSESDLHHLLKRIGVALLIRKGCSPVGMEIRLPTWERGRWQRPRDKKVNARPFDFGMELPPSEIGIADAAGVIWIHPDRNDFYGANRVQGIFAIEAKVSRSDFQRGFCTHGWNKMWILSPPDLLDPKELPPGVGHYEYDPDKGTVALRAQAALRPFEPSEYAVEQMRESILWQGYGASVAHIYKDERVRKVLGWADIQDSPETEG